MTTLTAASLALMLLGAQPEKPDGGALKWVGCDICKAAFMDDAVVAYEKKSGVKIGLEMTGDKQGIVAVASGTHHLGGTCRHTRNVPEERGVKLVPVAWDALVITVHPTNPVSSITAQQIREVFTGKITNWKELGGKVAPILAIEREGKASGVGGAVRELLFHDPELEYAPSVLRLKSSNAVEVRCETEPNCLALTGISSARLRPGLKVLAINGKEPSRENMISGEYVLYRPLYLSFPVANADPRVGPFVKWMLGAEGQAIIAKTGTVTLSEGKGLWEKYKAAIKGSK